MHPRVVGRFIYGPLFLHDLAQVADLLELDDIVLRPVPVWRLPRLVGLVLRPLPLLSATGASDLAARVAGLIDLILLLLIP